MAPGSGSGTDDLTHYQRFCQSPRTYHIFFALRVLEAQFAERPRLGESRLPREDAVRLGQEATMAFQRTTISAFTPPAGAKPGHLSNLFFGLFGSHGPLPAHLTEYARERQRSAHDATFGAFANMLTHRHMSLFYRAWASGQPTASFDRGSGGGMERRIAALSGYLGKALQDRDAMPDLAKRHFAGRLAQGARTAEGLAAMLSGFFAAPVRLEQFVGSWLELEPGDRWHLGGPTGLGRGTVLGSHVRTRSAKFRIRIGPLSGEDYRRLLPGGPSLARLAAVVRNAVGDALDWDVNLVLRGTDVPRAVLGEDTRLGQTSWLGTRPSGTDAADLFLTQQDHLEAEYAAPGAGRPPGSMEQ
ncbi:type VI secretion system baseplate subunit TssG [Meridianimarinicoccus roseus]|jgi:type VI secretion system protein ImpH|uniref:Type VI secretion system baseplate subunit TssG n=1 Tax=Meridianimarinicoccus roseus TaxID=2072018 RepID=A0A2V2L7Q8_9RHOB|nr:type VI secretion system baseplate subunit TssG [Meridianimarinicoccus roseus]PWR01175.1 type VI secretion system baseplate subunit TssG [Meridianimarinicoccus roseus]